MLAIENVSQYCLMIISPASLNLKETILKETKQNISHQSSFILTSSQKGEIDIKQIKSSDNLADLFIKSLPVSTFKKLVHNIGMRHL